MILMASSFKRIATLRRIRTLLSSSIRDAGSPDWSNKGSDLCRSMAWQTMNISVFSCWGVEWCREHWCHRWSVSGLGLMGNISLYRPGLSGHMLWRCVSTFIHFNLSNTTLTEGTIHYFATFHHTHTHSRGLSRRNFLAVWTLQADVVCVCVCECVHICMCVY